MSLLDVMFSSSSSQKSLGSIQIYVSTKRTDDTIEIEKNRNGFNKKFDKHTREKLIYFLLLTFFDDGLFEKVVLWN